jgi:hypothetical protein
MTFAWPILYMRFTFEQGIQALPLCPLQTNSLSQGEMPNKVPNTPPPTFSAHEWSCAVFNVEVSNTCQMPFWPSKKAFFFSGTSQKCALQSGGLSKNGMPQNTVAAICK